MKIIMRLVLVSLLLLNLSSCLPDTHPPIGVWKSEYPNIKLYIKAEYQRTPGVGDGYPAIYFAEGEAINVFVAFGPGPLFAIYDMSAFGDGVFHGDNWLFTGGFRITNDELLFSLSYVTQERTGFQQIIFHRLEEYDPINPQDWWAR